ncbi:MAG: head GIN domain-containing protein [Ferruginibacter sp.]
MRSAIILFYTLLFCSGVYAQKEFVVDPNAEMRQLSGSFNAIVVSDGIDVYLSQSDNEVLAISASEEKFKEGIKSIIENNVLKIYYDGNKHWNNRNRKMKAYISFRNIERLEASGASDIKVAGEIRTTNFVVKLSGASDFNGMLAVTSLTLDLSGASDVKISGTASTVTIESSGASDVKGFELSTDVCTAKASGASDINITVNKELNANASGASNIFYKGEAVIKELKSSGASSVSKKNRS